MKIVPPIHAPRSIRAEAPWQVRISTPEPVRGASETASACTTEKSNFLHDAISKLAHSHWEARGCPVGSPEEDWLRAEAEIRDGIGAGMSQEIDRP
jgi:hypothetical protein